MEEKPSYQPQIASLWGRIVTSRFPEAKALPITATGDNQHRYGYDIAVQLNKNVHVRLINTARVIDRTFTELCNGDNCVMEVSLAGKCYDNPPRITREIILHARDEAQSVQLLQQLEERLEARRAAANARAEQAVPGR